MKNKKEGGKKTVMVFIRGSNNLCLNIPIKNIMRKEETINKYNDIFN